MIEDYIRSGLLKFENQSFSPKCPSFTKTHFGRVRKQICVLVLSKITQWKFFTYCIRIKKLIERSRVRQRGYSSPLPLDTKSENPSNILEVNDRGGPYVQFTHITDHLIL
ncbi:unnamed protein product [Lepeophtheirus salmonis]|uniref:(salmon louse) hypothetical protein n=1 Tax=Lepeophtheirus salmonis TaxID=72036 RepID=A0A7R8CIZ6_LEPSM|nr:unnamed protein product [Lepeophtheirus salmonis]CAF2837827.1 unnamed protein product [Lepeophtheirus salmonis]